jgi:TRAP-type transport system periplasmic protein
MLRRFLILTFLGLPLAAQAKDTIILRVGTVAPAGTPWEKQIKRTRTRLLADSNQQIKMKIYLGGKKGDEKSLARQCRDGRLEHIGVSTAALATVVPSLQVLEFPFLFNSSEEADFILDQHLRSIVDDILQRHGFVLHQWAENGWHNFGLKDRFIKKPSDLVGQKMRSQESPVHLSMWRSFGAAAVEMAVSEVLPSLKTGLVNGFSQTPLMTFAAGWHQGIGHYTVSRHLYQPALLVYSKKFFDTQSSEVQAILMDKIEEETRLGRRDVRAIEQGLLQNFINYGIKVYELNSEERQAFSKRATQMRREFMKTKADKDGRRIMKAIEAGRKAFRARKKS